MTTDYSGGGDPARSLPLLWRDQKRPTRGPRPGLSVDRVVAAAIELADAEGLEALSMRRVAEPVVLVVTDGEPTAHLEDDGTPFFCWPPMPETIARTVAEVERVARTGAVVNVFALDPDPGLVHFVHDLTQRAGGRVFQPDADRLGVGTMSLYTYVPGKAELLDVMLDTVLAEVARPDGAGGWRAGLERRAREDWALFHRHPWMLQISPARALLGPNETELFEASLSTVAGTGLSGAEMVLAVSLVGEYTRGAAQSAVGAAMAEQRTGISDEQWWAAREPLFDKYFDPSRYPTVTRVAAEGAFEQPAGDAAYTVAQAQQSFEFGLARVLDGIEAFIKGRSGDRPARRRSRPSADDK